MGITNRWKVGQKSRHLRLFYYRVSGCPLDPEQKQTWPPWTAAHVCWLWLVYGQFSTAQDTAGHAILIFLQTSYLLRSLCSLSQVPNVLLVVSATPASSLLPWNLFCSTWPTSSNILSKDAEVPLTHILEKGILLASVKSANLIPASPFFCYLFRASLVSGKLCFFGNITLCPTDWS